MIATLEPCRCSGSYVCPSCATDTWAESHDDSDLREMSDAAEEAFL